MAVLTAAIVCASLLGTAMRAPAQQIVVDDGDGAPTYTETGSWTTTTSGIGYNGTAYRFTRFTDPPSTATWRPNVPQAGSYEVIAVFLRGANRTARAPYTIAHLDGTTVVELDQTGPFSGEVDFVSLGAYRFAAGTAGSVTLSNNGGEGVYIADAMIWEPDSPPEISRVKHTPLYPKDDNSVLVTARVVDNGSLETVRVRWSVGDDALGEEAIANDEGVGGDYLAEDGVYTATIPAQPNGTTVYYAVQAIDTVGSTNTSDVQQYTVGVEGDWHVIINEVMASNSFTISDPDFQDYGDWVEFYNFGPDTADLSGLHFSDRINNPTKWTFPPGVTISPEEYLLVWCNGFDTVGQAIHTNFSLSASGEDAVLYDPMTETILDQVTWTDLGTDDSLARIPNLTGDFVKTIVPTPGAPNEFETRGATPLFSHGSGLYSHPIHVAISAPRAEAVRYTLDGSIPGPSDPVYTAPIEITDTTGLRARAWYSDASPSHIRSASYFFDSGLEHDIPIINIVIDPDDLFHPQTGIYINHQERGREWERTVHVSIFEPDGSVHESIDAGLRMHGGFSRSAPKKSFRLYFRNDYGQHTWSLPWLERSPAGEIRHLVLRAGGNDGFLVTDSSQRREVTFIRDQILRDWYSQQGHFASDGFFAALYLNGEYWGLYNPIERVTNHQMEAVFGGGNDWDTVKGGWTFATKYFTEANDGDLEAWEEFLDWQQNRSDLRTDEHFEELKRRIDLDNFLDFFALNIAVQNEDWPHNNWIASRNRTDPEARWIFHEWDAEWALGLRPQGWTSDSLTWAQGANFHLSPSHNGTLAPLSGLFNGNHLDPNRTHTFYGILDHPQGRRGFIRAMEDVLNFELEPTKAIAQFDEYVEHIRSEVPREAQRWAPSSPNNAATLIGYWESAVPRLREFLQNRPTVVRNLMQSKFGLEGRRTITFVAAGEGEGTLRVRGREVPLPWTGTYFADSDVELTALPARGSRFESWSGAITGSDPEAVYTATSGSGITVILNFSEIEDVPSYWLLR